MIPMLVRLRMGKKIRFYGTEQNLQGSTIDMSVDHTSAASLYSFSSSRDGSAMLREAEARMLDYQIDVPFLPTGKCG